MPAKAPKTKIVQVDLTQFNQKLSPDQREELLNTLKVRFENNMNRHKDFKWSEVRVKFEANFEKLQSVHAMELMGGEPDVVDRDKESGEIVFYDCSAETPQGRRNVCYDGEAQKSREKKGVYPAGNAIDLANAMGIELLTEEQYRELQKLGEFDLKTSSWITTPPEIRKLGGSIFCDRRYDHVFVYHNGAPSFYGARGFRGSLRV